ncbi:MAG: Gfo/Idh/MocA family oxidoreductase [Acidobacteria bacterium]|nr:Gfo/Idh/MocA family oxidoreductase [Acidobacteriota bacterium]
MMSEIRIGIVGSGFMGRTNAETVTRYLTDAKLVAVAGGSRAPKLASDYGVECEPSPGALFARKDIDAVFISTPHADHAGQAAKAARQGKHVLLDKPMATSVAGCDAILAATGESNVNVMIMFGQRFRTVNREAYRLIQEGAIGRVTQLSCYSLNGGGLGSLPPWQSQPENMGTLFGHGVHNIDLVRWFTGSEVETVAAHSQEEKPGHETSTMAVLGMRSGVLASLWVSWSMPAPGFPASGFSARVVGEKGLLELDAYGSLRLGREGSWTVVAEQAPIDWKGKGMLDPARLEAYQRQGNEFLASIREKRKPAVTGEDGRAAVAVALAAYESSKTKRTISLGER